MKDTKIRWSDATWNFLTGCTHISPGCDHCYAEVIAEKFRGSAFPNGFEPTFKGHKLGDPRKWRGKPRRIFTNSMSDLHHEAFTDEQIDAGYDAMLAVPEHDYLCLTKRPQRMVKFLLGPNAHKVTGDQYDRGAGGPFIEGLSVHEIDPDGVGYLARRGLTRVPDQIWLGTTIESDTYTWRADWLRAIPVLVRFLSCEPLIAPVPSLDLTGIGWVIEGGESGNGTKDFRAMDVEWARDLRDRSAAAGIAFFHKQMSAVRTEMGMDLDGLRYEEHPLPHPSLGADRVLGRYVDTGNGSPNSVTPVTIGAGR